MSFDRLAPIYLWMERLAAGGKMQRCRLAHLERIGEPRRILLAGEGHGRFLPVCLRRFPEARVTVLDASAGMLERARIALQKAGFPDPTDGGRVEFVVADVLTWKPAGAGTYDLVVTHFFLDCFTPEDLERVIGTLGAAAAPNADWLIADFRLEPSRGAKRFRTRAIVGLLYGFFRFWTGIRARFLASPDLALRKSGFSLHHQEIFEWGLLQSQWWRRG